MGEPIEWSEYATRDRVHRAVHFREDFMFETPMGWIQGKAGMWLVELNGPGSPGRFILTDTEFRQVYIPL